MRKEVRQNIQRPEKTFSAAPVAAADTPEMFDEQIYLRLNPDVFAAVSSGLFASGRDHYDRFGRAEGRPILAPGNLPRDRVVVKPATHLNRETSSTPAGAIDTLKLSPSGGLFISGWVHDPCDRIDQLELNFSGWSLSISGQSIARVHRPDVEVSLGKPSRYHYGFVGFFYAARHLVGTLCSATLHLKTGRQLTVIVSVDLVDDIELLEVTIEAIGTSKYLGNPYFLSYEAIAPAIGPQITDFNRLLTRRAVTSPYVKRLHAGERRYGASIITCLSDGVESLFLQQALFSKQGGIDAYEFIYIAMNPALSTRVLREAELAHLTYGRDITVIIPAGLTSRASANNVAAKFAASSRLIFLSSDMFPKQQNWALRHNDVIANGTLAETQLFGGFLYDGSGSLWQAGSTFALDKAANFSSGQCRETSIAHIERCGQDAFEWPGQHKPHGPTAGISGAFMSIGAEWFWQLNGFTEDYIGFTHDDADLCLKSLTSGTSPWLHDLELWHLNHSGLPGKPFRTGTDIFNRWLFTQNWQDQIGEMLSDSSLTSVATK